MFHHIGIDDSRSPTSHVLPDARWEVIYRAYTRRPEDPSTIRSRNGDWNMGD